MYLISTFPLDKGWSLGYIKPFEGNSTSSVGNLNSAIILIYKTLL